MIRDAILPILGYFTEKLPTHLGTIFARQEAQNCDHRG